MTVNEGREEPAHIGDLYRQVPQNTFTRTISNPETVMKRKRERKVEEKLKQIQHGTGDLLEKTNRFRRETEDLRGRRGPLEALCDHPGVVVRQGREDPGRGGREVRPGQLEGGLRPRGGTS